MEKFMLVSLDADKKVLKESVDLNGLIEKVTDYSEVTNVFESLDVLTENGYRVIIDTTNEPFMYGNEEFLQEAGIKELYEKFKSRFKDEDEFEKAYSEIKEKKMKEGTWNPIRYTPKSEFAGTPSVIKGVSAGTKARPMSMRSEPTKPAAEPTEEQKAREVQVKKSRKFIPSLVSRINNMFNNDPDGYRMLISQLKQNEAGMASVDKREEDIDSLAKV